TDVRCSLDVGPGRLDLGSPPRPLPSGSPGSYLAFRGGSKVDVIVTLDPVPPFNLDQWRRQVQALLRSVGASRPETAAAGYSDGPGDGTSQHAQLTPRRWPRYGDRRE